MIKNIIFDMGEERFDSVSKRVSTNLHDKLRKCVDNWDICTTPVDGVIEFVKLVKNKGYRIFVLSNACKKNAFLLMTGKKMWRLQRLLVWRL